MSYSDWSGFGPRRQAEGIRAQTQRGQFGKTWWAGRWLRAIEALTDPGRLSRGRSYARSGQVTQLDVAARGVDARVQGSMPKPYKVGIRFKQLSAAEWGQVLDAMAEEASYAAKLLSGEMPADIENAFAAAGTSLFPSTAGDIETSCSCPDWSNPCKHVAAVYYLLGERFDADPFLLFLLRGRDGEQVAAGLRARRGTDASEAHEAASEPEAEVPLLAGTASSFWLPGGSTSREAAPLDRPAIDALPVKSLGTPAFWAADRPFAAAMDALYRSISVHAKALAVGADE